MADIPTTAATPTGTSVAMEDYIEGAPEFYWQGRDCGTYAQGPDTEGFYWGLTGTADCPVYHLGCYEGFSFSEDLTISDVMCDTIGVADTTLKRNYLMVSFTLKSIFPFSALSWILKGGAVTQEVDEGTEEFGLGEIDNTSAAYFRAYFSLVYDTNTDDFYSVTGHRCRFVDAFTMDHAYGEPVTVNVTIRMHADDDMPVDQRFATFVRLDPSQIP
jgi:hypothetical protein